jgi:SAM-dependent methyltransferase
MSSVSADDRDTLARQVGVWDRMSDVYVREIDSRFEPVVDGVIARAGLQADESVLDLGTGTGAVAERAAAIVGSGGTVVGVDISQEMLVQAQRRLETSGVTGVDLRQGRAEEIPAESASFDVVLASLSMMFVIDRERAAQEIARVLRPEGRFVASVWAGPDTCDLVAFQQIAGRAAGTTPIPGAGPGALADPSSFVQQLEAVGIQAQVERETTGFDFEGFESAWNTFAGVTTAQLPPERQQEAKNAVLAAMYPDGDRPRHFNNETLFIVGHVST